MKRSLPTHWSFLLLLSLLLLLGPIACRGVATEPEQAMASSDATGEVEAPTTSTTKASANETAVAATPTQAAEPTATRVVIRAPEASSFFSSPSPLTEAAELQTVPAESPEGDMSRFFAHPAFTSIALNNYPVERPYREPGISIFPVEAYSRLQRQAALQAEQLQGLLAQEPAAFSADGSMQMPYLPVPNAAQIMWAQPEVLSFDGGSGIRYLTLYAQAIVPVTSENIFYTFQGLSDDGRFYISASLPVSSNELPANMEEALEFDGATYMMDEIAYQEYLAKQRELLNSLEPDAFTPNLDELDQLMASLVLSGYEGPAVKSWAPEVEPLPDQVVDRFLEEYVAGGGFAQGAHLDNPALQPEFVDELEAEAARLAEAGVDLAPYDPILMSTNLDFAGLTIGPPWIDGEEAVVLVERRWAATETVLPLRFFLRESQAGWRISGVSSLSGSRVNETLSAPMALVEELFSLALAYADEPANADELPALLDMPVDPGVEIGFCAQDWPLGIALEGAFLYEAPAGSGEEAAQRANVVLYPSFYNNPLTVELEQRGEEWWVTGKRCSLEPAGRALAFYSWYLGEAARAGETRWAQREPAMSQVNGYRFFLTERFYREAKQRMLHEDPYLPSGTVPNHFTVEAGATEREAVVTLYPTPQEAEGQQLLFSFEQEDGRWLLDDVQEMAD